MAEVVHQVEDVSQALEVEEGQISSTWRRGMAKGFSIVRPAHRHGHVGAIGQAENQVRIDAAAQADYRTTLAMERVMGMRDGHIF